MMRSSTVAKEGALAALAAAKPGAAGRQRDYELEAAKAERRAAVRGAQGDGRTADAGRGKRPLGPSGPVPHRFDAATKTALLHLLDDAVDAGWTLRRACHESGTRRGPRASLDSPPRDRATGRQGTGRVTVDGLLAEEATEILALFDEWGETDCSHRKLAHRGSYLDRCGHRRRACGGFCGRTSISDRCRSGTLQRKPFPGVGRLQAEQHLDLRHHTLHQGRDGGADHRGFGWRKWITEVVTAEETSTRVEVGFTDALDAEGLLEAIEPRARRARQHRRRRRKLADLLRCRTTARR